jgi:hypothetical protein
MLSTKDMEIGRDLASVLEDEEHTQAEQCFQK